MSQNRQTTRAMAQAISNANCQRADRATPRCMAERGARVSHDALEHLGRLLHQTVAVVELVERHVA